MKIGDTGKVKGLIFLQNISRNTVYENSDSKPLPQKLYDEGKNWKDFILCLSTS